MMFDSREDAEYYLLEEIAREYETDHHLIFSSNNEFIRYHRGEYFGSRAWFEQSLSYKYEMQQNSKEDSSTQGELF